MKDYSSIYAKLENIYESNSSLKDNWLHEKKVLSEIIPKISKKIEFNYEIVEPIGVGGSGIVFCIKDRNTGLLRALKVARPSLGKERVLQDLLKSEKINLLRLSHPNLIKVFFQDSVNSEENNYQFFIMEFIEGRCDPKEFFLKEDINFQNVINIFLGLIQVIEYIHSENTIHMDIKPGNVLITNLGDPILSDFGFAKNLKITRDFTTFGGTEEFMHPKLHKFLTGTVTNPNRTGGDIPRNELCPELDLFSLGKTYIHFLSYIEKNHSSVLTSYQKRYLRLLACRLLDGQNSDDELSSGLTKSVFNEIKYTNADEARRDIEKLSGTYNLEAEIPELNFFIQETIQISTLSTTPFTKRVEKTLNNPLFSRLGNVSQLSLLNMVYPTATHSRLEHSIGTFSILCRYINALYTDTYNPLFKQIMNIEDLKAVLIASLVHDIGYYSLAHDVEEAVPNLTNYEKIGQELIRNNTSDIKSTIESEWKIDIKKVLDILNSNPEMSSGNIKSRILHSLLDGPLDADKIDYIIRDSNRLGLRFGSIIDFERLLRCLTIVYSQKGDQTKAMLGIHEKGKVTAESIAFARYAMFGNVYWHHTYRSFKIMFHRLVWDALLHNENQKKKDFLDFILPNSQKAFQPQLFQKTISNGNAIINPGDLEILIWFKEHSGEVGYSLFEMIINRNLYKRLVVISKERDKSSDNLLWKQTTKFITEYKEDWRKKLKLQNELNNALLRTLESLSEKVDGGLTKDNETKIKEIIEYGKKYPIVLVDIPPLTTHSSRKLEYLVEEDRSRYKVDEIKVASLEESVIWKGLQDDFRESIGKVRIFGHPLYNDFLRNCFSRDEIETMLISALESFEET